MKKNLSLVVALVLFFSAGRASAELRLGGEAAVRMRGEFRTTDASGARNHEDDLKYQYRIRLNAAADLSDGYFFKAMVQNEDSMSGGWQTVGYASSEEYDMDVSNFYFGRALENSSYAIGRLPLGSTSNPIYDLTLYPTQPLDIPVSTLNLDRFFGVNYSLKAGPGNLSATVVVLDNAAQDNSGAEGDGLFNDSYAFYLGYRTSIGNVTIEPEFLTVLTNATIPNADLTVFKQGITPLALGANVSIPVSDAVIGLSGFYTMADDTVPNTSTEVDYSGCLLRIKAEKGPLTAWFDYNRTTDRSSSVDVEYVNMFVWAQYRFPVFESAAGSFTLTPTLRYLTSSMQEGASDIDSSRLRTELYATMTF
jgi:hypothetical protein